MDAAYYEMNEKPVGFDIKKFFLRLLRNYIWFALSVALFIALAYVYLKRQTPMHQVSTSILLHPEQLEKGSSSNFSIVNDELVTNNENMKDLVNNEVIILKSRSLIKKVVDSLKLEVSVIRNKKNVSEEALPFVISVKRQNNEMTTPVYNLKPGDLDYKLISGSIVYTGRYGEPLVVKGDSLLIQRKEGNKISFDDRAVKKNNQGYSLQIVGLNSTIGKYVARISVSPVAKAGVGMVEVSVKDEFYNRAKRFIEVLIYEFNSLNIEYKNQAERKTLEFLNKRIDILENDLKTQEGQVSDFKSQNQIYDVSASAGQLLNELGTIDEQKSQNDLKENLLNLVETNVQGFNGTEEIVPNSNGLQDEVLIDQINQYNKQVLNKRMILDQGTAHDPRLLAVNGQLEQLRSNILKNIANIRRELTTTKNALSFQEKQYSSRFESLPQKEKEYIQLSRSLGTKESLYAYLLQKREESSLRLVSADMAQSRIIDEGVYNGVVSPNKRKVYAVAGTFGMLVPFFILLIAAIFKRKIDSRDEIESQLSLPIAGEIGTAPRKKRIMIVSSGEHTPVAEQLRTLRSNIFHQANETGCKTVMITSYMRGEGKSFIALNFADAVAATGKKVILLDFDLRKGILSKKLDGGVGTLIGKPGITDFLNGQISAETIIYPLKDGNSKTVHFIPAGNFINHPSELILNEKMQELFGFLRKKADIIIIDTPPVGFVSDAITLGKWCDATLFIIRHNFSLLHSIKLLKDMNASGKLPDVSIVVNGIHKKRGYEYGGYGYGYHYNSYIREIKAPLV